MGMKDQFQDKAENLRNKAQGAKDEAGERASQGRERGEQERDRASQAREQGRERGRRDETPDEARRAAQEAQDKFNQDYDA
ncbi:hypothetical protein GCM10010252_50910 [Streptomyces aureoverticillatus]|nr:hypothetical protein GCM10010252_50910 [Streptomyces aureoverticillatus]